MRAVRMVEDLQPDDRESSQGIEGLSIWGRLDGFLELVASGQQSGHYRDNLFALTLRCIDNSLEHQRHEDNEKDIVDKEFRGAPEGWRRALGDCVGAGIFGGRSRVGVRSCDSGGGKASVEGVQRVNPPEPGEEGGHFMAVA